MTVGHLRRWMPLPIGVASLVQALGLWNFHQWTSGNGDTVVTHSRPEHRVTTASPGSLDPEPSTWDR